VAANQWIRIVPLSRLAVLLCALPIGVSWGQSASLVQTVDTSMWSPPSPDASGVTYIDSLGSLLVADSEVNETPLFTGDNLFEINFSGTLLNTLSTIDFTDEPSGIAYDVSTGHLFFATDNAPKRIYELDPGADGLFDTADDVVTFFSTTAFGSNDPEGVTFDPVNRILYLVDGVTSQVRAVDPGANGLFDGVPPVGDDTVSSFDTAPVGITDPEGIAFDTDFGHLYLVGKPRRQVAHVTVQGSLIRTIDIAAADARKPSGLAYAPGSQQPGVNSLYVAL